VTARVRLDDKGFCTPVSQDGAAVSTYMPWTTRWALTANGANGDAYAFQRALSAAEVARLAAGEPGELKCTGTREGRVTAKAGPGLVRRRRPHDLAHSGRSHRVPGSYGRFVQGRTRRAIRRHGRADLCRRPRAHGGGSALPELLLPRARSACPPRAAESTEAFLTVL
jgi:hypothetical protein